jgi:hypothetical protein
MDMLRWNLIKLRNSHVLNVGPKYVFNAETIGMDILHLVIQQLINYSQNGQIKIRTVSIVHSVSLGLRKSQVATR